MLRYAGRHRGDVRGRHLPMRLPVRLPTRLPARVPTGLPSRRTVAAVCLALVAELVGAGAVTHGPVARALGGGTHGVEWSACGADGEQCATVKVPLDYANPSGRMISIAIDRYPARTSPSLGPLLLDPGGPGGSGIELARALHARLPAQLRDDFDIIGFDPRGVGESTPVVCPPTHHTAPMPDGFDATPRTTREVASMVGALHDLAADCASGSGDLLPYLGTEYAARDIDEIRAALGAVRISYLGFSYGTVLGAVYSTLFPSRVRAMVLDGAADATYATRAGAHDQALSMDEVLTDFLTWCVGDYENCPFVSTDAFGARRELEEFIDGAGEEPYSTDLTTKGGEGRPLFASEALDAIIGSLYVPAAWPQLESALGDAMVDEDGTALLALDDKLQGRDAHGNADSNLDVADVAIRCADLASHSADVTQVEVDAAAWEQWAPMIGSLAAWTQIDCNGWAPTATPPIDIGAFTGSTPILVVNATHDPATPYAWAQRLVGELKSARLLTRDGDGHTSFLRGSACIDDTISRYLTALTMPAANTVCASAPITGGSAGGVSD
jgi:pimeloyl-ACP methyl ester carboxylesterase